MHGAIELPVMWRGRLSRLTRKAARWWQRLSSASENQSLKISAVGRQPRSSLPLANDPPKARLRLPM